MRTTFQQRLDAIDIKPVLLIMVLGVLLWILYKYSNPNESLTDSLTTKGKGRIISVTPITQMRQGKMGTKIYIESYKVSYKYSVDGMTYEQTDYVKNMGRNQSIINSLNNTSTDSLEIIYNDKRPKDSKIYLPVY